MHERSSTAAPPLLGKGQATQALLRAGRKADNSNIIKEKYTITSTRCRFCLILLRLYDDFVPRWGGFKHSHDYL